MDAIYSFKKLKHYKPFDETFFRLASLSIQSAKQFYNTILYADEPSSNFLLDNGLKFDKVVILGSIANYNGSNYAMPKILTMINRTEPYIHLDFDSILIEKPQSTNPVSFPFPEINSNNIYDYSTHKYVYDAYVKCFIDQVLNKVSLKKQNIIKWDIFPNNSALLVNNPKIVSSIFKEIITEFVPNQLELLSPSAVEQQYLLSFLTYYQVPYDFRSNTCNFSIQEYNQKTKSEQFYYLDIQTYVHLCNYTWYPDLTNKVLDFYYSKLKVVEQTGLFPLVVIRKKLI